jgi:hypothetical protein
MQNFKIEEQEYALTPLTAVETASTEGGIDIVHSAEVLVDNVKSGLAHAGQAVNDLWNFFSGN